MARRVSPFWAIVVSILVAMLFSVMPVAEPLLLWRPDWVLLVVVFWVMHAPSYIGIWMALIIGLLLDVLLATPLAFHGTAILVAAYLATMTKRWGGVLSMRQSTLLILGLVIAARAVQYVLHLFTGLGGGLVYQLPGIIASTLIWPAIMLMLMKWSQRS